MKQATDLVFYRKFLVAALVLYFIWYLLVLRLMPEAYNPLGSRLFVLGYIFAAWLFTFHTGLKKWAYFMYFSALWLLTAHFWYLIYRNGIEGFHGYEVNWIAGSFIVAIGVAHCMVSARALLAYSVFATLISVAVEVMVPAMESFVFLPGIITVLIQANLEVRIRHKVVKDLQESNTRFWLLFNSTFEGVMVYENERVRVVNEAILKMSGYSREELIGRHVLDIIAPEERAMVAQKMALFEVPPYETKGLTKSGRILDIEVRAKSFQLGPESSRLVTVQDITDRKTAELERVKSLSLAENVRVRDEFISIASHELKTPISSILMQVHLFSRDLKKERVKDYTPQKFQELIDLFYRQINRLGDLVDTMLDVSRISSGRLVLDRQSFDLCRLVRETSLLLHHPEIRVEALGELTVNADQSRIQQVVDNLVSNAIKYGNEKPISVRVYKDGGEAVFEVQDQGIGIAPEHIDKIFERFERAISSRNISGLGLGLYIARQVIDAHAGKLFVESRPGKGSTFTFRLPL